MRQYILIMVLGLCSGCNAEQPPHPWLHELDADDGVKSSGLRLMSLEHGLHALERANDSPQDTLLVGVHGYASEGYEWVYPLQKMDSERTSTYYYRWDYKQCAEPSADSLQTALGELLKAEPGIKHVQLVGHSYGGILVSLLVENWTYGIPIEIHAVAAPLAGMGELAQHCGYMPPDSVADNVTFFQWRTRHHLDNAFRNLDVDPQIINLPAASIIELPDTYRGRRLGHNWSLSWVADELATNIDDTFLK